jgi:hypothetical protein
MDEGTALDHIEDLMAEREALLKQIRELKADLSRWTRIGHLVFTHNEGCLPNCRRACMCTCGFEHYRAQVVAEEQRENRNG